MWYDQLSAAEVQAIRLMVERLCSHEREDIMGCILKTSGHQLLDDAGVVELARKLGEGAAGLKFLVTREKPLLELTAADVPRGMDHEDVASDCLDPGPSPFMSHDRMWCSHCSHHVSECSCGVNHSDPGDEDNEYYWK